MKTSEKAVLAHRVDRTDVRELPKNIEAEQVVLGAAILEPASTIPMLLEMLTPAKFYENRHRVIFKAIQSLSDSGKPADIILLANWLEANGVMEQAGGRMYLNQLLDRTTTTASLEYYAGIVHNNAMLRFLITVGDQIAELGFDESSDSEKQLDAAVELLSSPSITTQTSVVHTISQALDGWIQQVEELRSGGTGLTMGFPQLDKYVRGANGQVIVGAGLPGMGKCQKIDTPILMYDGTIKPVQDIVSGELLMGPDSKPRKVLGTNTGRSEMYEVTPAKGDSYTVNDEHILSLKKTGTDEIHNLSIQEYFALPPTIRPRMKGWRTGVDWEEKSVPLDPYFFGVWLGDGCSTSAKFWISDTEISDEIYSYAPQIRCVAKTLNKDNGCDTISVTTCAGQENPLLNILREMRVFGNKHIPHEYMANSRQVRLELLAGLIDTDGGLESGCYRISQKREQIARGITFIARSLGLAAYCKQEEKMCYNNGVVGTYWRVTISGDVSVIPVRVSHKTAIPRKQIKNTLLTGIEVKPVGVGDWYGFELDGDHLYMLGDFTVTHNTALMLNIIWKQATAGIPCAIISLEMTKEAVVERLLQIEGNLTADELQYKPASAAEAIESLSKKPIKVIAMGTTSSAGIVRQMRLLHRQGIRSFCVDYLQLMTFDNAERRDLEIGVSLRMLLLFAKSNDCCVLTGSQINRAAISNEGGWPKIHNMKESGAIESHADIILGIHRPGYHNQSNENNEMSIEILKNRKRGFVGSKLLMHFNPTRQKINESSYSF